MGTPTPSRTRSSPRGSSSRGAEHRPAPRLRSLPVSRLASVYPIVSARSLARPFTYEIGDEVRKGAVLAIPFGNAHRRGVVVDADAEAPPDVEPVAAERVLETLPPALVDLALWLADYYGPKPPPPPPSPPPPAAQPPG